MAPCTVTSYYQGVDVLRFHTPGPAIGNRCNIEMVIETLLALEMMVSIDYPFRRCPH